MGKKRRLKGEKRSRDGTPGTRPTVAAGGEAPIPNARSGNFLKLCLLAVVLFTSVWVFAIYWESLDGPFLFDDQPNIELNTSVRWGGAEEAASIDGPSFDNPNARRPVSNASFGLNHYFHGYAPRGYRVLNLLIHLLNGLVVYLLIRSTLRTPALSGKYSAPVEIALTTSLLFLLHPVAVQSVAYIVQRMTSLASLFFLLSLLLYAKARLSTQGRTPLFGGSLIAGLLALGSKEIAATLPFVILLYEFYFFQNLDWERVKSHSLWVGTAFMIFVVIALLFLGDNPLQSILAGYDNRDFSLGERLLTEMRAVVYYLTLFVFPHPDRLHLDYDFGLSTSLVEPVTTLASLFALLGLIGTAFYTARRHRLLSFAIWWYLINLVIESSVIPLEIIYEHRTYLPFVMLFAVCAASLTRLVPEARWRLALVSVAFLVMSFWTFERAHVWADDIRLWQDSVSKSPGKARPHHNLGVAFRNQDRYQEAIAQFTEAIRLDPSYVKAFQNLGDALLKTGDYENALQQFGTAAQLDPSSAKAYLGRGNALLELGRSDEAADAFGQFVRLSPNDAQGHLKLGIALADSGQASEALSHFERAADLDRKDVVARRNLAFLWSNRGETEKTIRYLREATRLEPTDADIWADLGLVLLNAGKKDEATEAIERAIELDPDQETAKQIRRQVDRQP